jgi:hypothetical protein
MGSFTNGLLVGIGISLLFAPRKGEETRGLLVERIKTMRGTSAEGGEREPSAQGTVKPPQPLQEVVPVVSPIEAAVQPAPATTIPFAQSDLDKSAALPQVDAPPTTQGDTSPTQPLRRPGPRP